MGVKDKEKEKDKDIKRKEEIFSKEFLEATYRYDEDLKALRKTLDKGMAKLEKHADNMLEALDNILDALKLIWEEKKRKEQK